MLAEGRGGAMAVERKQAPRAVLLTLPLLQNHPSLGLLPPSQRGQDTVPSPCSSLSPFAFGSSELWLMFFRFSRKQRESKNNGKEGTPPGIKIVKNTYSSVEDYISPFEPLLFEEVKAQIVQRNDDDQEDSVAMVLAEHLRIPLVSPPRLLMGVLVQVLCSYITLPLYALISQVGSMFNKHGMFNDHMQSYLSSRIDDIREKGGLLNPGGDRLSKPASSAQLKVHKLVTEVCEVSQVSEHRPVVDGSSTYGAGDSPVP